MPWIPLRDMKNRHARALRARRQEVVGEHSNADGM